MTRLKRAIEELRGRKPAKNNPVISATVRPGEEHGYGANRRTTHAQFVNMAVKWTAIAVDRNANAVAQQPLRVMRRGKGQSYEGAWRTKRLDRWTAKARLGMSDMVARKALSDSEELEEITDPAHPLVRLLAQPNPWTSGFDLIYEAVVFGDLTGNDAIAHVKGPGSPVYELWTLPFQHVRLVPDSQKFIAKYIYGRGQEVEQEFDPADITHIKYPNPTDPYMGRGCVAGYVGDAQLSMAFTDVNLAMLDNGASPSLIFRAPNATKDQAREIEDAVYQRWSGLRNAFKAIVMRGDMELVNNTAQRLTEMPFMLSDESVADLIANSHGMSPALLRMDSAALATAQAALPHWQRMAIKPRCIRIAEALNRTVVEKFREALGDESLCVVFDDPVTKDEAAEATRLVSLVDKILTKNECRGILGYEAVEGGDDFPQPVDPFADPFGGGADDPTGDNPKDEPKEPGKGAKDGTDEEKPKGKVLARVRPKSILEKCFEPDCGHVERRPRTKKITEERKVELTALQMALLFSAYFDGASDLIVNSVTAAGVSVELARLTEYREQAMVQSRPLFEKLYRHGYNFGVHEVNSHGGTAVLEPMPMPSAGGAGAGTKPPISAPAPAPDSPPGIEAATGEQVMAMNERAASFLDGHQRHLYRSVSETVDKNVRSAIAKVMLEGGGVPEMKEAVKGVMTNASNYGAERIAKTESARAYALARKQAWKESGIVVGHEWLLSGDPCGYCIRIDLEHGVALLDQPFVDDVYSEPAHPNCACSTAAIFDDDPNLQDKLKPHFHSQEIQPLLDGAAARAAEGGA